MSFTIGNLKLKLRNHEKENINNSMGDHYTNFTNSLRSVGSGYGVVYFNLHGWSGLGLLFSRIRCGD